MMKNTEVQAAILLNKHLFRIAWGLALGASFFTFPRGLPSSILVRATQRSKAYACSEAARPPDTEA